MVAEIKNRLGFSQGLLEGITLPCIVSDLQGNILFLNQAVIDFVELDGSPADYLGTSVAGFFHGEAGRRTIAEEAVAERRPIRNVQEEMTTARATSGSSRRTPRPCTTSTARSSPDSPCSWTCRKSRASRPASPTRTR
jgi:PAS domain-containing protein